MSKQEVPRRKVVLVGDGYVGRRDIAPISRHGVDFKSLTRKNLGQKALITLFRTGEFHEVSFCSTLWKKSCNFGA
jgi:hypothetical protein